MNTGQGSGFSFGNVGGSVKMSAGGDLVGRDKISLDTPLKAPRSREELAAYIEQLRQIMTALRSDLTVPTADQKPADTEQLRRTHSKVVESTTEIETDRK